MPARQQHFIEDVYLVGITGTVPVGTVLCGSADGKSLIVASLANRTATGRQAECIALTAGDANNLAVEAQWVGAIGPSISGLLPGAASLINVSDAGVLQRTSSTDATIVGRCDADGTAYVCFPLAGRSFGGGGVTGEQTIDTTTVFTANLALGKILKFTGSPDSPPTIAVSPQPTTEALADTFVARNTTGDIITLTNGIGASNTATLAPDDDGVFITTPNGIFDVSGPIAVVFNDFVRGANSNIVTARTTNIAPIDNTKTGITCLASDTAFAGGQGTFGNYSSNLGGSDNTIKGNYAVGAGFRANALGDDSTAFGFASFADGEGCGAIGHSVVAGQIPGVTLQNPDGTEKIRAFVWGYQCNARASYSTAGGNGSTVAYNAQGAVAVGLNNLVGSTTGSENATGGVALGNQNEVYGDGAGGVALGTLCKAGKSDGSHGTGAVALGYNTQSQGNGCVAMGIASTTDTHSCQISIGNSNQTSATSAIALGTQNVVQDDYGNAQGLDNQVSATAVGAFAHGQGSRATLPWEEVHSAFTNAVAFGQNRKGIQVAGNVSGTTTQNLLNPNGAELVVPAGKAWGVTIRVIAARQDASATPVKARYEYLMHTSSAGALTIDNGGAALESEISTLTAAGHTLVISAQTGGVLRFAYTATGTQSWKARVTLYLEEIGAA